MPELSTLGKCKANTRDRRIIMVKENPRIIIALDYIGLNEAIEFVDKINPERCRLKIGIAMFTRYGPACIECFIKRGFDVFLDLKFYDIPNTVELACHAAADLGVWMLTIHAAGGEKMMLAALKAFSHVSSKPLLIGVTLLTSMSAMDATQIGLSGDIMADVTRLAELAQYAGLDGIVCSAKEVKTVRQHVNERFLLITPGIRLTSEQSDQHRVMTPEAAIKAGADYLVIGRPITQADDPMAVIAEIEKQIS